MRHRILVDEARGQIAKLAKAHRLEEHPVHVIVETLGGAEPLAAGHFGEAVLTFQVGYLFRTPPGIGMLVCISDGFLIMAPIG